MVLLEALVQRKSLVLILVKQVPNFSWVGIIMMIIVICLLMKKKSVSLKPIMKVLLSLGKYLWKEMYDFSVGFNGIDKSDILNIHKYLMVKNNIIK